MGSPTRCSPFALAVRTGSNLVLLLHLSCFNARTSEVRCHPRSCCASTHGMARRAPKPKRAHMHRIPNHSASSSSRSHAAPRRAPSTRAPMPTNASSVALSPMTAPSPNPLRDGHRRSIYASTDNSTSRSDPASAVAQKPSTLMLRDACDTAVNPSARVVAKRTYTLTTAGRCAATRCAVKIVAQQPIEVSLRSSDGAASCVGWLSDQRLVVRQRLLGWIGDPPAGHVFDIAPRSELIGRHLNDVANIYGLLRCWPW